MCDKGRGQRVLLRCGKVALKGPTLVVCANRCVRQLCRMTSQKMADGVRQRLALITDTLTKGTTWGGLKNANCKLFVLVEGHIVNHA